MQLSSRGRRFIQNFERLELTAYLDVGGVPTIGWGHTGECSFGVPVAFGQTCTLDQAETWFDADVLPPQRVINKLVVFALTQSEFDALVSFTYNVGAAAFAHSTLLADIRADRISAAAEQFLRWDYVDGAASEGLESRRKAERLLFLETALTSAAHT